MSMKEEALAYQGIGLSVLPWAYKERHGEQSKLPTRQWQGKAQWQVDTVPPMTPAEIEEHWGKFPDHNVGIVTGHASGVVVVDCDTPEAEAWALANLPATDWRVRTGRGLQLGYRQPGFQIKTAAKLGCRLLKEKDAPPEAHAKACSVGGACCGMDIRGHGGFVGMPPSLHKTGRLYEWEAAFEVETLPEYDPKWIPFCDTVRREKPKEADAFEPDFDNDRPDAPLAVANKAAAWAAAQPPAISGQGGRNQTFKVAATLIRDYALSTKQAWGIFKAYNERCVGPWTDQELWGKLTDAALKGTAEIGKRRTEGVTEGLESLDAEEPAAPAPAGPSRPLPPALVDRPKPAPAPIPQPEGDDKDFLDRTLAEAGSGNPGHFFEPAVIGRLARIYRDNRPAFENFKAQARTILSDVRDLLRAVKQQLADANRGGNVQLGAERGDRKRVALKGDEKLLRDAVLDALKEHPGIYCVSGKLSYLNSSAAIMQELFGGALHNVVVNICEFVKQSIRDDGTVEETPAPLPSGILNMLENLLPEQVAGMREVLQVTQSPFFTPTGQLVQQAGYNTDTKALLLSDIVLDPSEFTSTQDAAACLYEVFCEFDWQSPAEWANYVGALLTPMVRHMYKGATPWLLLEANTQGAGKSLLADCIQLLYGYDEPKYTSLPPTEEAVEKLFLSTLSEGRPIVTFDNLRRALDSPTIESVATSAGTFQARILGKSENRSVPVKQLFVVTSNNTSGTVDASRRLLRARLCKTAALSVDSSKPFRIRDLREYVRAHRARLLSAMARLVQDWLAAGRPEPSRLMPTYEVYSRVVGAIVQHAGMTEWLGNFDDTRASFTAQDDFEAFVIAWWDEKKSTSRPDVTTKNLAGEIYNVAVKNKLLGGALAGSNDEHARISKLGALLAQKRDAVYGDLQIHMCLNDKKKKLYWLQKRGPMERPAAEETEGSPVLH